MELYHRIRYWPCSDIIGSRLTLRVDQISVEAGGKKWGLSPLFGLFRLGVGFWLRGFNFTMVVDPVLEGAQIVESVFVAKGFRQFLTHGASDTGETVEDESFVGRWLVETKAEFEFIWVQAERPWAGLVRQIDGVWNVSGGVFVRFSHVDNDVFAILVANDLLHLAVFDHRC